jgi:predicted  nucleic acid-binding Zn-ribbon protein
VNADPATQRALLDLQSADTTLAQLQHRRRTLPELAALQDAEARATTLRDQTVDAETATADIDDDQRRLEAEVETVRNRAQRDEQRLQAGGLPSRELESLQHEIATLGRRQSILEDEVLEVMERREEAGRALEELTAQLAVVENERIELEGARDRAFAEIDAATAAARAQRARVADGLPGDLVALYEKARAQSGVGAALLRARRCEGCHIELPGSEQAAVQAAAADEIVRCDNCRTILVRTDESGL